MRMEAERAMSGYLFYNSGCFRDERCSYEGHVNHHLRICCSNHEEHRYN
ncbi:unnamed protein product [Urochloa humidicola]